MSDNTVGSMYLAASERNAQRIADLQAEVERLRAQLAEKGVSTMDTPLWSDERIKQWIGWYDDGNHNIRKVVALDLALQMRDEYEAKIAELDEWQPVPDGKYNTLSSTQLETAGDKLYHLFGHGYYAKVAMPDDLRLCRRKAKE